MQSNDFIMTCTSGSWENIQVCRQVSGHRRLHLRLWENMQLVDWNRFATEPPTTSAEFTAPINIAENAGECFEPGYLDQYGAELQAFLHIQSAGEYTFYLESDDASELWIDGSVVVNDEGLHSMQERSGTVELTQGMHNQNSLF